MISFGLKYWPLFLIPILIIALGIVIILYFRNKENAELTKQQLWTLRGLRFISFILISVLLLSPLLKNLKKIIREPLVILAWDNSSSNIANTDSAEFVDETEALKNRFENELGSKFSLIQYTFGEEVKRNSPIDFSEKKSHYGRLLTEVNNNHFNENIGALVIIGDGIYNQGRNPVNLTDEIAFPVFTVALGDTTEVADARIEDLRANRTAFLGNYFTVEADVHFSKLAGVPLKLTLTKNNLVLEETINTPPNNNYIVTHNFLIEAAEPGINTFSVQVEPVQNEINTKNNQAEVTINVLENKQKILLLSEGPHPDLGAIKNTLELQPNYEVSLVTREPYPENLNDFNLIIVNQIPSAASTGRDLIFKTMESKTPLLFLVGSKTFIPQFNQLNPDMEIIIQARNPEEAQAALNNNFELFKLDDDLMEMSERFPPLTVPFAEINLNPSFHTLFYQNLNNIKTFRPLISLGNIEGRKTGVIFGEGIWRWRLYNYYYNESHDQFTELITSIVQYLSLRENEDNFIVNTQPVYFDTDAIILRGEVYNEAFELITNPEVNIELTDEKGNNFQYTFDKRGNFYTLNTGKLPAGNYHYEASVIIGDEEFTEEGDFTVVPLQIEDLNTRADFNVLFQMANLTGGSFFYSNGSDQLLAMIKNNNDIKPTEYFQASVTELLNLKWLFVVLLIVFGVEWFLRKYWGIY